MSYFYDLDKVWEKYRRWLDLLKERGGKPDMYAKKLSSNLEEGIKGIKEKIDSEAFAKRAFSNLEQIKKNRPKGPRRLTDKIDIASLQDKLYGAWLGRCAGCILGIPVEGMRKEAIKVFCENSGVKYPISDYWVTDPKYFSATYMQYDKTPRKNFLKKNLKYVGADDDLAYTILGLLILEKYGENFTTEDVGKMWLEYLPFACTAEKITLENLKKGIPAMSAGSIDNPYQDWIGADIRSDPWGYAAAGWPEKAAEFAYRDAFLSHRGTGIHGEMFFSALISAAFVVKEVMEAIEIGLTEIPRDCALSKTVKQTLQWCEQDKDWERTVDRILSHFQGMHPVHTLNNAALTIAGLVYGENNFERTITLTVMSGFDTDCTAATAGSISGAILGIKKIPAKWKNPLGNKVETYLNGKQLFYSDKLVKRFMKIALQFIKED
ncbi:MAG: ADP-ribosylglycohydrolase family protein [Candidatus Ratteibacteria bacterium]